MEQNLVEERTRSTHYETGVVETTNTWFTVCDLAFFEMGADVAEWCEGECCWIPRAHLIWVKLVHSGVERDNLLSWVSTIRNQHRHRCVTPRKLVIKSYRGECICRSTIYSVDQLIGQGTTPVVCDRDVVARIALLADLICNIAVVTCRVEDTQKMVACWAVEDVVFEFPDVGAVEAVAQGFDGGEVVGVDRKSVV